MGMGMNFMGWSGNGVPANGIDPQLGLKLMGMGAHWEIFAGMGWGWG